MSPSEFAVIALLGTVGWFALVVVTMHFRHAQARLCETLDRVVEELVGLKNPWVQEAVNQARAQRTPSPNGDWPAREAIPVDIAEESL